MPNVRWNIWVLPYVLDEILSDLCADKFIALTNASGVISDIWTPRERGTASACTFHPYLRTIGS